ncbi:PDR/VanB family oxidoreductase [Luteibacter aegosomatissinici]|uniref:PDR/VanB family oxidoreductase n=1 Tax=Luteibacter aegosomatissinici TaxID=2911539 RepID=UPI001FF92B86|nr:PDR/VanB family oxidoreductase [Luteibacter aegosomatissinici]UPG96469.1 PDR/VanB family oxidoreductase [Luteibacter aegosomatissinici]
MTFMIRDVIQLNPRVREFRIARQDGARLPAWMPGSHVILRFNAADGRSFENHYSLVGVTGPADAYRIAVQREDGGKGGSACLHDEFAAGSVLEVLGPFDSFPLTIPESTPAPRIVLIAGGIGVTPLVSMAHALACRGVPFVMHHLARNAEQATLTDELCGIAGDAMHTHYSERAGRVDFVRLLGAYEPGAQAYVCGPSGLIQALAQAAEAQGWPADALHVESFGARAQPGDAPLTVELALSELTVEVQPGTSILDALIAADVFVSWECKRGECGNCFTQVLDGEPLHRDVCLTPAMRSQGMCTCVSWAQPGRLVLEL